MISNNKTITIFTVSLWDNGYLSNPVIKFCMSSWYRLVDYLTDLGYTVNMKIYDHDSPEVKEFLSMNIPCQSTRLSRMSNIFRCWILSKNPHYLYLDGDIYINEKPFLSFMDIKYDKQYFYPNWSIIYNANNTKDFENIFNLYKSGYYYDKETDRSPGDAAVFRDYFKLSKKKQRGPDQGHWNQRGALIHLSLIDACKFVYWTHSVVTGFVYLRFLKLNGNIGSLCLFKDKKLINFAFDLLRSNPNLIEDSEWWLGYVIDTYT